MSAAKSPIGRSASNARGRRARQSAVYRAEQARVASFEALARIVVKHRLELDLTQEELAERMGTSHSAVSRIESGRHRTSIETLRKLGDALGLRFVMGFESGPPERPVRELVRVSTLRSQDATARLVCQRSKAKRTAIT